MTTSFYEILGVSPNAETSVIDAAYRTLRKRNHPDALGPTGSNVRCISRTVFRVAISVGLICGAPTPAAASQAVISPGGPLLPAPPRQPITDPQFAASPIRELRRAWDDCTWAIAQTMAMNQQPEQDSLNWIFNGCADEESRLTGALVRKYGFRSGNAAMDRAKKQLRDRVAQDYADKRRAAENSGVVAAVGGWTVRKHPNGGCTAISVERDFLDNAKDVVELQSVTLKGSPGKPGYLLTLGFIPTAEQASVDLPSKVSLVLGAEFGSRTANVYPAASAVSRSQSPQGDPLILLLVVLDEPSLNALRGASVLWVDGVGKLQPLPFHPGDFSIAAGMLSRCAPGRVR